ALRRCGKAPRLRLRGGQGEEPCRNHRVGPWVPVIPVKVGPSNLGGDSLTQPELRVAMTSTTFIDECLWLLGTRDGPVSAPACARV
ncbi:MAG TPA: hypothetical protein VGY54_26290, partial [Polyangiaceae bacterium]|nr:hypothetical protein [Polyangiaceae bacterium]